jgi:hypothetical protein
VTLMTLTFAGPPSDSKWGVQREQRGGASSARVLKVTDSAYRL